MIAMSSALPDLTGRTSLEISVEPAVEPLKAPNRMLGMDRPIARPIIWVSSVPEAPTSVPATISSTLLSTAPDAATARPLNAFTGLAVAASGAVLSNVLLIVAGTLVGASGTLLTQMMGRAMGRSIPSILFGAFKGSTAGSTEISKDVRPVKSGNAEDIAIMLAYSQKVTIVPGYGLAVAQGQHTVRELADLLASKGVDVSFAIHPVAGRMPGHMNVLLAEANVPYEKLREMDDINPEFPRTDVVLVIGANDVVNPAAKTDPGSPIYGMPILNVDESK